MFINWQTDINSSTYINVGIMENKFYIYAHINKLTKDIFYIGKGKLSGEIGGSVVTTLEMSKFLGFYLI